MTMKMGGRMTNTKFQFSYRLHVQRTRENCDFASEDLFKDKSIHLDIQFINNAMSNMSLQINKKRKKRKNHEYQTTF